jgi:phenylalanine-4-hydroxylase
MDGSAGASEKKTAELAPAAATMLFSIREDRPGALSEILETIREADSNLSLTRIESRPARPESEFDVDFLVQFPDDPSSKMVDGLTKTLSGKGIGVRVLSRADDGGLPWFPMSVRDLDQQGHAVFSGGAELDADHPGFTDDEYKARRKEICDVAAAYRTGMPIPRIEYTDVENSVWNKVYSELVKLYPTHACGPFNKCFRLLEEHAGYSPDKIPQLDEVSQFIQSCTGFTLRPVTGLLSPREFLNGLAFRVFHSTQYIRHASKPLYTPEPDVCHELLGHVPLFCDRDFAEFSQEIGLASLGASEEQIKWLSTTYWFTVEFGVCREKGELRAYGAGLLSSFGELKYCLGNDPEQKPEYAPFDPHVAALQEYPITTFQPKYFVAESFRNAKAQLQQYAKTIKRPFVPHYDPYTQKIELIEQPESLETVLHTVYSQLSVLEQALALRS